MIIWLVSYPRSGNTLTRSVFNHYFNLGSLSIHGDRADIASNPELGKLVGHIDGDANSIDLEALRRDEKPYLIKTHNVPDEMTQAEDTYVHIVRDGRDSSLSYLKYNHNVAKRAHVTLSDVVSGRVAFGSWGRHTLSWAQANPEKYKLFKFEEIVADIPGFAQQLSELMGLPANTEPFPDIEKFQTAARSGFVGAGRTGNWQKEFSDVEAALFDLYNGPAMRLMGYGEPEPSPAELNAYSAFCTDIQSMRSELETAKELLEKHKPGKKGEQHMLRLEAEVKELREKVSYLEPKARKRNRRINRLKSLVGIRKHRLPWEE